MKKIAIGIVIGTFIGLLVGGMYWHTQYFNLYKRYDGAIELLKLYKAHYERTNN